MKFSHKMPLNVFYTMVQKRQKWPKSQIKGVLPWGHQYPNVCGKLQKKRMRPKQAQLSNKPHTM